MTRSQDVAIVGMSCLFPGSPDLRTFWENVIAQKCCISDHPAPEALRALQPESADFERIYTTRGGFLGDSSRFDPLEFGIMPASVEGGDPDHFLALRVASEALCDAGLAPGTFSGERTDVILGHGTFTNPGYTNHVFHADVLDQVIDLLREMHPEYTDDELTTIWRRLRDSLPPLNAQVLPAIIPNVIAGRISNRLDLMGTSHIVDAACASTVIALNYGMMNLLSDRCDIALIGGSQACLLPPTFMVFCSLGALSRQQQLRPFDASADGTLLGEGLGMLVLKRREDAERDGNRIYALVKGVGVASDGKSKGLLAPRLEGEALAIERAYRQSGIDPSTVHLVEAHGTGIPLGDQTEVRALNRVFGTRNGRAPDCALGSVKSMVGHCVPAAGAASLIKTALALQHKILPATLGVSKPHPDLGLEASRFYLNCENRPWIHRAKSTPRRAGVSAMGFGGINSHCILEEYV
jgi:acyl transferase domain-containing protein